jgi:hypothetical protein
MECTAGTCTDTSSDPKNCGACGTVCQAGSTCSASLCTCLPNRPECVVGSKVCNDLVKDNNNCGGCGVVCTGGKTCKGGSCKL